MHNQQKSASIHRHFHYHYHYTVNDKQPEILEKYSSNSSISPRQSYLHHEKMSWKNYINPQVTRLFEQISDSNSLPGTQTPRPSSFNLAKKREDLMTTTVSNIEPKNLGRSRIELIQQIQKYEEYLKKRSSSNLYIPKTVSLIKFTNQDSQNPEKACSLQDIRIKKAKPQKNLQDLMNKRTDSKILSNASKIYESTTAHGENQIQKQLEPFNSKQNNFMAQKISVRSQIQSPNKHFMYEKPQQIVISNIQQNNEQQNFDFQKQSFSLFQRSKQQQSFNKGTPVLKQSQEISKDSQQGIQQKRNKHLKRQYNSNYHYQLVQEECEYLRNKFIEHYESKHNIKI